jgi:hypothetical protein
MTMKKYKFAFLLAVLLTVMGHSAFALNCAPSRNSQGPADDCYTSVTVASNETTLVSAGTVLVYDVANAQVSSTYGAFWVKVSTASAQGVRVAGVAQNSIASGATALVLVRGRGDVAVNTNTTISSGDALFVGVSGDSTTTTSTTQTQLGFALESQATAAGTPGRATKKAYITIV